MKRKTKLLLCLGVLGLALILVSAAVAQSGGDFALSWLTLTAGGSSSTGGNFLVSGSFGQEEAGSNLSGGIFSLSGGFWANPELPTAISLVHLAVKSVSRQPVWVFLGLVLAYGMLHLARKREVSSS